MLDRGARIFSVTEAVVSAGEGTNVSTIPGPGPLSMGEMPDVKGEGTRTAEVEKRWTPLGSRGVSELEEVLCRKSEEVDALQS